MGGTLNLSDKEDIYTTRTLWAALGYLLTNDLNAQTSGSLSRVYQKRGVIETVFRDLKQVLHLEKCQCRSLTAQFNHIIDALKAYLYLKQAFEGKSTEAAQQEFLAQFRVGIIKP